MMKLLEFGFPLVFSALIMQDYKMKIPSLSEQRVAQNLTLF